MSKILKPFWVAFLITSSPFFIPCNQIHCMQTKPLIAGICANGLPYAEVNQIHELFVGFDIDLACALAQKLGQRIIFSNKPYQSLLLELKAGKIDILGFSYIICPEKLESMDMIDVYDKPKAELQEVSLIFWKQIPEGIRSINDLKNQPIAVRAGAAWITNLKQQGFTNIIPIEDYQDLIAPIKNGPALAAVVGPSHGPELQVQHPDIKFLKFALDKPWGSGVGFGVKKGNSALRGKLEQAVEKLQQDGTIDELKEEWFRKKMQ